MKKKSAPKRSLPPPSDEELAAAERTQTARDQAHAERVADEQDQTRLAAAGDPDAIQALAGMGGSVLLGRTIEPPEPQPVKKPKPAKKAPRRAEREIIEEEPPNVEGKAYRLMDVAMRKWARKNRTNPREALRDLATDLGQDFAFYVEAGLLRMNDLPDLLIKLSAMAKPKEEKAEGAEDFDEEMETLRAALRGK